MVFAFFDVVLVSILPLPWSKNGLFNISILHNQSSLTLSVKVSESEPWPARKLAKTLLRNVKRVHFQSFLFEFHSSFLISGIFPSELAQPVANNYGQWCVPRSAFAIILAVTTFLIIISTTILIAMVLEKRRRRVGKKSSSEGYSSIYMSHYGVAFR